MAKVSLRSYNREIETMVDRGQLDEAIAHCRHILNIFPKNLETYRLLGKSYLEARRYNEATDIFERLLMAVPDDFVAHVGMSIIHDEQNDLDEAIWHMERAFEVQPSNAAIQSELQRLFGRRDGVEPPKIRLTRGALAHMYVQGELYPQAISEIKAVLEEDSDRQDMQVLLARAYFRAGQKNEAAEICSQLLRRYPYSFDANRIVVELLPETEHGESPQTARQRVNELDPYATFASGSVFQTDEVADAAVSLERLDWDGQPVDLGEEWKETLGIGRDEGRTAGGEEDPDWLKNVFDSEPSSASTPDEQPASVSSSDDDIPDFLREAGWGKDTGAFQEGSDTFATSDESTEEPELAEGDLPDWIKAMAPAGADVPNASSQDLTGEDLTQDDVPDWLQGLGDVQDTPTEEQPLEEGDLPDWLAAMKPAEEIQIESQPEEQEQLPAEPMDEEDLPDWLRSVRAEEEQIPTRQMPAEETQLEGPQEPAQESPEVPAESLSDWQVSEEEKAGEVEFDSTETGSLGASAEEQDDAIAWLEGLAAKHGAKPDELVTDQSERTETEPEWVRQAKAVQDEETAGSFVPEEEPVEEPSEDLPDFLADILSDRAQESGVDLAPGDNLGTSAEEQDDAIAWLESLAAKHGAKPEELVTDPEARKDTAPEWVQKAAEAGGAAQSPGEAGEEAPTEEPLESIPDWIEPASEEEGELSPELEDTQPSKAVSRTGPDETGTWLRELEEEGGATGEQEPVAKAEPPAEGVDEDVPDWLRGMEAEASKADEVSTPEEQAQEVPDWLSELGEETTRVESGQPSEGEDQPSGAEAQEVPDWLSEPDEETTKLEAVSPPEEEIQEQEEPDWLRGVEAEPAEGEGLPEAEEEDFELAEPLEPVEGLTSEVEEQEIPDWLRGVESVPSETDGQPAASSEEEPAFEPGQEEAAQPVEAAAESEEPDFTEWLKSGETEEAEETGAGPGESVQEEPASDDFPSWLAGLEEDEAQGEKPESTVAEEDLPAWLRGVDEGEPSETAPTAPTDWQPAEAEVTPQEEPQQEPEPVMEEPSEPAPEPEPDAEPEPEPVAADRPDVPSPAQEPVLAEAQAELGRGNVSGALNSYEKLIRKGKMLDEIIYDLREALDRYPVDVSILQALGDAYMRSNRLQDALDAYTKAEELLR